MLRWVRRFSTRAMSPPRTLASSGFTLLEGSKKVEEEQFSWYNPSTYYPVRIGQLFQSRYQVLSKLGYGTSATVWLCRDLMDHRYVALKVCTRDYPSIPREKAAFERLRCIGESPVVQKCWDSFTIEGIEGAVHECFVLEPLSISLAVCSQKVQNWDLVLFRLTALKVLEALKFLHTEAKLIHCDLRQENFLLSVNNDDVFREIEALEAREPSPRKIEGERVVHTTPYVAISDDITNIVLSDFGETRPGDTSTIYYDDIQPFPYRAPEVVLEIPFSYPVDIWNAGVMLWHMFENQPLFSPYLSTGRESNIPHVAQMVAIMGPPPLTFLERVRRPQLIHEHYFDTNGQWISRFPIPRKMSLESKESRLDGENKAEFLRFIRRFLQWEPEKRATAAELCEDRWLNAVDE
ncbi:putative CDK4/6 [Neolentinus lepideus HHB14362 ss-1]|uniref:Putative CDK4/6 n=1 Tax=Neolentinus lepideus HHB14362 ss-1 TaxID=1314782 RepID=A0A165P3K6_9AGAM|nr:putative CDK4/6 [Neolentinus lepideus HHB14362 ss-1]